MPGIEPTSNLLFPLTQYLFSTRLVVVYGSRSLANDRKSRADSDLDLFIVFTDDSRPWKIVPELISEYRGQGVELDVFWLLENEFHERLKQGDDIPLFADILATGTPIHGNLDDAQEMVRNALDKPEAALISSRRRMQRVWERIGQIANDTRMAALFHAWAICSEQGQPPSSLEEADDWLMTHHPELYKQLDEQRQMLKQGTIQPEAIIHMAECVQQLVESSKVP